MGAGAALLCRACQNLPPLPAPTAHWLLPAVLPPLQPISGTRQYRTVNHDASEALEHAHEPWTPRPDPHRLMQLPPQPPAAEVLHSLGSRHGVVDFQEYIRVVQVRRKCSSCGWGSLWVRAAGLQGFSVSVLDGDQTERLIGGMHPCPCLISPTVQLAEAPL